MRGGGGGEGDYYGIGFNPQEIDLRGKEESQQNYEGGDSGKKIEDGKRKITINKTKKTYLLEPKVYPEDFKRALESLYDVAETQAIREKQIEVLEKEKELRQREQALAFDSRIRLLWGFLGILGLSFTGLCLYMAFFRNRGGDPNIGRVGRKIGKGLLNALL
jgi:hypothetical protein